MCSLYTRGHHKRAQNVKKPSNKCRIEAHNEWTQQCISVHSNSRRPTQADIVGLDVGMDIALVVRVVQRIEHLQAHLEHAGRRHLHVYYIHVCSVGNMIIVDRLLLW